MIDRMVSANTFKNKTKQGSPLKFPKPKLLVVTLEVQIVDVIMML